MYLDYFGLAERPFSIAPDPQYLYMSARHQEAMAHLSYGLSQGGCFIVLTGEVGTGKTTLCRNLLSDLPDSMDVALILNANITEYELLQTVCDELSITYSAQDSKKQLLDQINRHLLASYAADRQTVLIIDEAQLLSRDVLEYVRLLTNLETNKAKLLQIILIGQPELSDLLARNDLRQLSQRVTARYHLPALQVGEIEDYVNFRLSVAGGKKPLFSRQALQRLFKLSGGIPRKINVLADHALLATYSQAKSLVDAKTVNQAAIDVFVGGKERTPQRQFPTWAAVMMAVIVTALLSAWFWNDRNQRLSSQVSTPVEPLQVEQDDESDDGQVESVASNGSKQIRADDAINVDNAVDESASNDGDDSLTTILTSPEVEPGKVVISSEYLDEGQVVAGGVASPVTDVASLSESVSPVKVASSFDENTEFGDVLDTSGDITTYSLAVRNLAQAWDVVLPEKMLEPVCQTARASQVACLPLRSWRDVLRFNRPSVLVLSHRGQFHRVILFEIKGQSASVLVGDQVYSVPIGELQARWAREGLLFWRPGELGGTFLEQGSQNAVVPLFRARLNGLLQAINGPLIVDQNSYIYDRELAQRVRVLQSYYGISADGKVGNETHLLLNELLYPEQTPTLIERVK